MSLAIRTASASPSNGITAAIGPKISSRAARSSLETGQSTVGGNQKPGPSGALPRKATGASSSRKEETVSSCPAEISGPMSVSSESGSPTFMSAIAASISSRKRSSAGRSTRIRERAQQSWPALPKTAEGAASAAASMSASAKTTFADLPPSSSVTRLIVPGGALGDPPADLGRAGEGDLGDVGVLDEPLPALAAGAGDDVEDALGEADLDRDPLELERAQRRQLGRLQHDRVAGGERRPELPGGDRQREVPGHDQADDAERLAEGHVDAAGDRDRVAEQPLRAGRVVAEGVGDHPDLAAGVADRLAGVARLERSPGPRAGR